MKLDFIPSRDGFHFRNAFVNTLVAGINTRGRCAGMTNAAIDYWRHRIPVPTHETPDFRPRDVPDGQLASYIYARLMNAMINVATLKFVLGPGVTDADCIRWSREDEFPKFVERLDRGQLQPVGLWSREAGNPVGHVILAFGYEADERALYVYDNNCPDEELKLVAEDRGAVMYDTATGAERDMYRGFFWHDVYDQVGAPPPPYYDLGIESGITLQPSGEVRLGGPLEMDAVVRNFGDYPAHVKQLYVYVRGPAGENLDHLLGGGDGDDSPIPPGGRRHLHRRSEAFGDREGTYTIGVSYLSRRDHWSRGLLPAPTAGAAAERQVVVAVRQAAPQAWGEPGGAIADSPTVAHTVDGRMVVFGVGPDGFLWFFWQTAPSNGWSTWERLPAGGLPAGVRFRGRPDVVRNHLGRLEVFVLGTNDEIWHAYETPGERQGWSDWGSRGGRVSSPSSGQPNNDNRLELVSRFENGRLRHAYQRVVGGLWSGWEGGGWERGDLDLAGGPVLGRNADGRLEAFARGDDGALHHSVQEVPGGNWTSWMHQPAQLSAEPTIGYNPVGGPRMEVFARAAGGDVVHTWQTGPNQGWSGFGHSLGGQLAEGCSPAALADGDGGLTIAAIFSDGSVQVRRLSAGGGWADWLNLGGAAIGCPALGINADGRLEVFVAGSNGQLQHRWQPW